MSKAQTKKRNQLKIARLEIVAALYKKGKSYRTIQKEVINELNLKSYSLSTVYKDVHSLLEEWRKYRIDEMEDKVQLELERIDDAVGVLWDSWEKSEKLSGIGNPDFIKEIRMQLAERRKLLGLYAPEKKDISGDMNFGSFLMESGLIDDSDSEEEDI